MFDGCPSVRVSRPCVSNDNVVSGRGKQTVHLESRVTNFKQMKKSIVMVLLCGAMQSCTLGKLVDPEKSKSYYIRFGKICYMHSGRLLPLRINADRKSFVVLSQDIGKDKESIYYKEKLQKHVDYPTFRIDKNGIPKDKNYVYSQSFRGGLSPLQIKGIDIASFEYLKLEDATYPPYKWSKDKNWYYLNERRLNTDYETTKIIGDDFFYDKTKLYIYFKKSPYIKVIQKITEPPKIITEKYLQSKNKIFYLKTNSYEETEIKELNYSSVNNLKIINKHVLTINGTVAYYGIDIPYFDAATFEKIKDNEQEVATRYYKDKNFVYLDTKIIKQANPETFVMIDYSFAKDDKHVFYEEKILVGADPKTFREGENFEKIDDYGNRYDAKGKEIQ